MLVFFWEISSALYFGIVNSDKMINALYSKVSSEGIWTHTLFFVFRVHAFNSAFYTVISAYATHGFPPNSNYPNQSSWYNYPANGYAGGYAAYPGASGYWSNANGPPSQSNLSTTPPSSQAMVQYPVCPRKPHPFLVQVSQKMKAHIL